MEKSIRPAAHLVVFKDEGKLLGKVVLADGTETPPFDTKDEGAIDVVGNLFLTEDRITPWEFQALAAQIEASKLDEMLLLFRRQVVSIVGFDGLVSTAAVA